MLKRTPHAAFSYVITRNIHTKGDTMLVDATARKRSHIFYVKGIFTWVDNTTGAHVLDCSAGDFLPDAVGPVGVFKGEALDEESIFYCVDPKTNKKELPELTPVRIDSQSELPAGTKLFLCEGTVLIKNKEITAPAQIKLASDAVVSCVGSPVYCLIFP
jgi:hypothetical protein